jgi:hyperosmotically inducible protein
MRPVHRRTVLALDASNTVEGMGMKLYLRVVMAATLVFAAAVGAFAKAGQVPPTNSQVKLETEVRHQLLLLPFYTVFDNLEFKLNGNNVTLMGQVTRPVLKSDAEAAIRQVTGVTQVDNQIEVLPVSPNDDRLRIKLYRAIYRTEGLDRYALRAIPTIHIIVKNGNVTLDGAVGTEMDKTLAYVKANSVPGVFSVTNNLRVLKD